MIESHFTQINQVFKIKPTTHLYSMISYWDTKGANYDEMTHTLWGLKDVILGMLLSSVGRPMQPQMRPDFHHIRSLYK